MLFRSGIDVHIMKGRLETDGIDCFVFDENIMTLNPLYNIAVGGVKLKVNRVDVDKAKNIIHAVNAQPITDANEDIIICPQCHSNNLYSHFKSMKGFIGIVSAIISFIFSVFPIYFKLVYKCKDCGFEFKSRFELNGKR